MAKGRMLLKRVSVSNKLNSVSIKSALLYSWLIPHLDYNGCFFGDPTIIKGHVMPRRKDFSVSDIKRCLTELLKVSLISLYKNSGETYLRVIGFVEKQPNLRKDREPESEIPPPENTDSTPTFTPDSTPDPAPPRIEENRIEENRAFESSKLPVDNSKKDIHSFDSFLKEISNLYPNFNPYQFINKMSLLRKNEKAVFHALEQLKKASPKPKNPWAYCVEILKVESGNFNERESIEKSEQHKKDLTSVSDILKTMIK